MRNGKYEMGKVKWKIRKAEMGKLKWERCDMSFAAPRCAGPEASSGCKQMQADASTSSHS